MSQAAFVDFQNDVTSADLKLALRENFASIEHVKRYTTAGMATDQGKMGNANVIGVVAAQLGKTPDATGTTTYRPPFQPVSFGVLAGHRPRAVDHSGAHHAAYPWHIDHGAAMNEAGANFRRPFFYPGRGSPISRRSGAPPWRCGVPRASTTAARWANSSCTGPMSSPC